MLIYRIKRVVSLILPQKLHSNVTTLLSGTAAVQWLKAIKLPEVKSTLLYEMMSPIVSDNMPWYYTNVKTSVLNLLMNSRDMLHLGLSSDK